MDERDARRNIRLLLAFRAVSGSLIIMPVITLFFQQNGLSQAQINGSQSIFAFAAVLFDVPCGWLADRFGRRRCMVIGQLMAAVGFAFYGAAYGFWPIAVAEVILGAGLSFVSGADAALAQDSLLSIGQADRYRTFEARSLMVTGIGSVVAGLAGGVIATYSMRATIYAQVLLCLLAVSVALCIKVPTVQQAQKRTNPLRAVAQVARHTLHGHKEIKWLVLYSAVVGTLTHTVVWLVQPLYLQLHIPISLFGVLAAGQSIAVSGFAGLANVYERLERRAVLGSFVAIGIASYLAIGLWHTWLAVFATLGFYFIRGVYTPIMQDYINRLVSSEVRATVLSVRSTVQRLLYVGAGPLIGWVADVRSLSAALLFSAVFYGLLGGITLLGLRWHKVI